MIKTICLEIIIVLLLSNCVPECADNKTGIHKSSETIADSKKNGLFEFELISDKKEFSLNNGKNFKIKNSWVESGWTYECINSKAVIQKESFSQFVIDIDYRGELKDDYWLTEKNGQKGNALGAVLDFDYSGQDSIQLVLTKNKVIIDSLTLKRKVSR